MQPRTAAFAALVLLIAITPSAAVRGEDEAVVVAPLEWEPGGIGRFGSQAVEFTNTPPEGVAPLVGVPEAVYGAAPMGDVRDLLLALDPDAQRPRIWVDTDMDGDLSDERPAEWKTSGATRRHEPTVLVPITGEEVPVPVALFISRGASEPGGPLTLYPKAYRTGEVVLAGRLRRVALMDETADLRFDDEKKDVFYVDVDGDGAFAAGHGTHEHFHFTAPVNIAGIGFEVRTADVCGSALEFRRIADLPEPQRRTWRTSTYAKPGREQTQPEEDFATLRQRFEDEVGKTYIERQKTVSLIGRTGAPEAVPFLLGVAAKDAEKNLQSAAVRALGNVAFVKAASAQLVKLAKGGDAAQGGAAIQALYDMGYDGREGLFIDLLDSSLTSVVSSAARYLAYEATDVGREAILKACEDASTPALRYQAYMGARYLPGGPPVSLMLASASDDYASLRARAIEDLAAVDHPQARDMAAEAATARPVVRVLGLAVARVLGGSDDPAAVPLLIDVAGAGDDMVRTEIVKRLRTLRSAKAVAAVLRALATRKDPLVRTIAARILAGIPEPNVTDVLAARAVREKDEAALAAMLEALGDHGDPAHAKLLIKAAKKKKYEIARRAAIRALGRIGLGTPEVHAFFLKLLSAKDWEDRIFAIDAAGASGDPKLVPKLLPLLRHDRRQVRLATAQALAKLRSGTAVKPLIDRLEDEELQRIRNEIARALFVTTGVNLYDEHALWARWWEDRGGEFAVPEAIPTLPKIEEGGTSASFYGIPVDSDRVTFVIDQSGSMSAADTSGVVKDSDGTANRLDAAVQEVLRALTQLDDRAYANVVFFHSTVHPWKDELVRLGKGNRADLSKHLLKQRPTGGTNLYDGLEEALLDPEVDTVMLLSDGVPGAGKYTGTEDILRAIRRVNQTRRVVIHCISLGRESSLLRKLAEENGGAYARR